MWSGLSFPASSSLVLDVRALSGIAGSISIACWMVVFSPQIIENFARGSADGLSLLFIALWLTGDIFNVIGAVLQGVLPTMLILAIYYALCDIVLLSQCLFYKGYCSRRKADDVSSVDETTSLLPPTEATAANYSPATPLIAPPNPNSIEPSPSLRGKSPLQTFLFNLFVVFIVITAGIAGYILSVTSHPPPKRVPIPDPPEFNTLGQVFGYLCAILYLSSRMPQILMNYRRKSTDGIALLFFLFACLGNMTYVVSILAYAPPETCDAHKNPRPGCIQPDEVAGWYWKYIAVNASWLLGSVGTLVQDLVIFCQFFLYGTGRVAPLLAQA